MESLGRFKYSEHSDNVDFREPGAQGEKGDDGKPGFVVLRPDS